MFSGPGAWPGLILLHSNRVGQVLMAPLINAYRPDRHLYVGHI